MRKTTKPAQTAAITELTLEAQQHVVGGSTLSASSFSFASIRVPVLSESLIYKLKNPGGPVMGP